MTTNKRSRETSASEDSPATAETPIADPAPVEVVADEPQITIERFARTIKNKELAGAYAHCEKLRSLRRMSLAEWQADFDAWTAAPRT